jgi:Arc/MetJ-type ribon-helix-helix transcriptional regulator
MNQKVEQTVSRTKHEERLTIRLSTDMADKIQTLVDAGLVDTKVEFVRHAIEEVLPAKLKKADEKTDREFDYLNLKEKLRVLKEARYQYDQNRLLEEDLLRR